MYLHIDMDYFFAQLEEKRHPETSGRVVVVCVYSGRTADSGVVSTVNYKGREYGIKSGMPIAFAKRLAPPGTVFLPVDHEHYGQVSAFIDSIIRANCGRTVQMSIDEWNAEDEDAAGKARLVKDLIRQEAGLSCTAGVAPSLLGAKMAAAKAKPDGLLVLDARAERSLVGGSRVEKVPGIGPKTAEALHSLGVRTVDDLGKADPLTLVETFGRKTGAWLHDLGKGTYGSGLGEEKEQSEVSRIGTLRERTRDAGELLAKLDELERDAKEWLMNMRKAYGTLSITFVTEDMRIHTRSLSFKNPKIWNESTGKEKKDLVDAFLAENPLGVRRIGIKFGNFTDMGGQTTLF